MRSRKMNLTILENTGTLKLKDAALSIRGQQRMQNDDIIFSRTEISQDVGLYVICDGIGGNHNGRTASRLAVGSITGTVRRTLLPAHPLTKHDSGAFLRRLMQQCVDLANDEILEYGAKHLPPEVTMETTVTVVLLHQAQLYIAHLGNSRVYLYRDKQITQLTQDHSVAAELVRRGILNQDSLASHPRRKNLLRTLGHAEQVEVDLLEQKLKSGDRLLICSDGLWQAYPQPAELATLMSARLSSAEICENLVSTAAKRDSSDNISAITISVEAKPDLHYSFPKIVADIWQQVSSYVG
jgi:protein phosphatase